ncbi:MAG: preprotein translocase subunit YajC [Oscillospiraceae bacterium]
MKKNIQKILSLSLALLLVCVMFAGCATTGEGGEATGSGAYTIIMLVVLIAVFYFFMIRPENKKKKKLEEMRSSLSVGDKITTIGGMVGKIVDVSGDLITFETGEDRVRIQVTKWAISTNGVQKAENGESEK